MRRGSGTCRTRWRIRGSTSRPNADWSNEFANAWRNCGRETRTLAAEGAAKTENPPKRVFRSVRCGLSDEAHAPAGDSRADQAQPNQEKRCRLGHQLSWRAIFTRQAFLHLDRLGGQVATD